MPSQIQNRVILNANYHSLIVTEHCKIDESVLLGNSVATTHERTHRAEDVIGLSLTN